MLHVFTVVTVFYVFHVFLRNSLRPAYGLRECRPCMCTHASSKDADFIKKAKAYAQTEYARSMARKFIESITDDIDGTRITDDDEGRSVQFMIDGVTYEIDLKSAHVHELEESLGPFIAVARKQPTVSRTKSRGKRPRRDKEQLDAIRRWARDTGYVVSDHGRIPLTVEDAYAKAH